MRILGIESSCDETAVALYDTKAGLLAHCLHSQARLHAEYGGIVPELASRDHIQKLVPVLQHCLKEAGVCQTEIDAIAYTYAPGLTGALMVGAAFAIALAYAWDIPSVPVHHLEAHLLAPFLETPSPAFPFVALLVSGGHTQLIDVAEMGCYRLLGETLDDAVGEAFDKTAALLGFPYPGGKDLASLARQGQARFTLPVPLSQKDSLDFSFSGLKTATRLLIERELQANRENAFQTRADIAASFEAVVVESLSRKALQALLFTGQRRLVVSGGVSANLHLRENLARLATEHGFSVFYPRLEFCTDNAAMVALTGALKFKTLQTRNLAIAVKARAPLSSPT